MKSLTPRFRALSISAVAALVGCGGSPVSSIPPGAPTAAVSADAFEPTLPGAKNGQLLYITAPLLFGPSKLLVFTYPDATFIGAVTVPNHPEGLCTDKNGNIFVTTLIPNSGTSYVYEYAHGGTRPIATLSDPGGGNGCAVDSVTGNLAVANGDSGSASRSFGTLAEPHAPMSLRTFPRIGGAPTTTKAIYSSMVLTGATHCRWYCRWLSFPRARVRSRMWRSVRPSRHRACNGWMGT